MGDDGELYEILLKLGQQAAEASPEELERALEIASTNGDYLMMKFGLCMKRIRTRPDLAPDIKAGADNDTARFVELFNAAKQWPPKAAAHVFELAEVALNTGLRVGAGPEEAEKISKEAYTELTQRANAAKRQKDDVGMTARRDAIRAVCAERGWRLDERGIAEALATEIKNDPRYKNEDGKPLFSVSRRTIATDLISLARTSLPPDKR